MDVWFTLCKVLSAGLSQFPATAQANHVGGGSHCRRNRVASSPRTIHFAVDPLQHIIQMTQQRTALHADLERQ